MQRPIAWAGTSKPLCYLFPRGEGLSTCFQLLKGVMQLKELRVLSGNDGERRVPELRLSQAIQHKLPDTRVCDGIACLPRPLACSRLD